MSGPKTQRSLPRQGSLTDTSVARLVLSLWREAFTGTLELSRDKVRKRITWSEGVPVLADSNRPNEDLCTQLVDADRLGPAQARRVAEHMEAKGVGEGAALLALALLDPKELVVALREQLRRRLVECFAWPAGSYALTPSEAAASETEALRVDPIEILHDGLTTHWSPERTLQELAPQLERYPTPGPRFAALAGRLRRSPEVEALVNGIDAGRPFGEAVHRAPGPAALAAAWVLAETGALSFSDRPVEDGDAPEPPAEAAPAFDIEIEVSGRAAEEAADEVVLEDAGAAQGLSPEAEEMRKEVLDRHGRLDEMDHYEVLGIAADAADAEVKKAYFGLAKRFHPDALSRAGLSEIHREANELFGRIAQAYQTLSSPDRRSAYDQSKGAETPSAAASRVAQAETLFRKGEIMIKVGNFAGALDFLRPCVELWPEEADYQAALGWALYKNKPSAPEKAREHLERALEIKADDPLALFRLGMVMRRLGDAEGGQALLDRSKALQKAAKG